ncbi:MAG: metallophosphoesterase family protein [Bacteroidales bacterium]
MKHINRRSFIKGSSLVGMTSIVSAGAAANVLAGSSQAKQNTNNLENSIAGKFTYNKKGKFKIVQFTDTHYVSGNPKSERALKNINYILDSEKPDLVIHTGDAIFGRPAKASMLEVMKPMSKRKIPFAITFGNHDDEFGKSRSELYDIIKGIPHNTMGTNPEITGMGNSILTISAKDTDKPEHVLYLFDSNAYSTIKGVKGYGHIHHDQIDWYRQNSQSFATNNEGKPVPALAFFHIPIPEYADAATNGGSLLIGTRGERVCCPAVNSGLFVSMKEMGDIQGVFVGHDHNSDFAVYWNKILLCYGRFSGCDTVYNNLKPNGARVIELSEGKEGFDSWIHLYDDRDVIHKLQFPEDFKWKK